MTDALIHRGPDSRGHWLDAAGRVGLGHRRLSILDLSDAGAQPMRSASGRYVISFNGEIYNHLRLKTKIDSLGYRGWRGHSDTEVLLAAIEQWGVTESLRTIAGMFAFALWDTERSCLYLARDRLGEKPIYYGWIGGDFVFASELKALRRHPLWSGEIDRDALSLYMRFGYVPAPRSIFRGICKLPAANFLVVTDDANKIARPQSYWSAIEAAGGTNYAGDERAATSALDDLLRIVVREQMMSDVPVGAFLSGGVDSSTIVALMQAQGMRRVKTFTVGFHDDAFNEADEARIVAHHLDTDHTEMYVSPAQAQAVIPKIPELYDEPFADVSQIPTYLIAALAREHVTVCLSGDGGDELFGGYNRYRWAQQLWDLVGGWKSGNRKAAARAITLLSPAQWDRLFQVAAPLLPQRWRQRSPGDKLHKLAEVLPVESEADLYVALVSFWKQPAAIVKGAIDDLPPAFQQARGGSLQERMMLWDLLTYLPDDILVKVDRATMGVSLEARVPLLDYRIVEFALRLPIAMKIRNGETKWLLRQVLDRYVPRALVERPKTGFGVPIGDWLRSPLRGWADTLLSEEQLRRDGFFEPEPITRKWKEHLSGKRAWQYQLWNVLMFQAWLHSQRSASAAGDTVKLSA